MSGLDYWYITQPSTIVSSVSGSPLSVIFEVYCQEDLLVQGRVDWQNGVHMFEAEGIEPDDFSRVMTCVLEAIKECRKKIGENWTFGGQGEPG